MDNWMKEAIQEIKQDIKEIKSSQANTEKDIAVHIRRTELAEENLRILAEELKPVKKHVIMIEGVLKFLGVLSLVAGVIATIKTIYKP
jgi:hypothetical protein